MTRKEREARLLVSWLRDGPALTAEEQAAEIAAYAHEYGMEPAEAWTYAQGVADALETRDNAAREITPDLDGIPAPAGRLDLGV